MKTYKRKAQLSNRAMAAVELLLRGVSDLERIPAIVGLTIEDIRELESADDPPVRKLISEGLPVDFEFQLRSPINCPVCGNRIIPLPCMTCRISRPKPA